MGAEEARRTILKRQPAQDIQLPERVRETIVRVFGEELNAAEVVDRILRDVQQEGDAAVLRYNREIDGYQTQALEIPRELVLQAYDKVDPALIEALRFAADRIRSFHETQLENGAKSFMRDGIGQMVNPLERAGLYVPGTQVIYPSSVLMTAIPARVAGVGEVIVITPGLPDGTVSPLKLAACDIAGVDRVFLAGGAQAIAALAYGTESVPRVDKICGPGNIFVTLAKAKVYGTVGIDALYGPSETIVIADEMADPDLCASDVIAQAEHDEMATPLFLTDSEEMARRVAARVDERLASLARGAIARSAWERQGGIGVVASIDEAIALTNEFAPEHVCLLLRDARERLGQVRNAGVVLVGDYSVESIGDYVAGPSHVMPTMGNARFASPLGVQDFLKATAVISLDRQTLEKLGPAATSIARAEGLTGHAESIEARLAGDRAEA
jgi:histidinol dehydrogenase